MPRLPVRVGGFLILVMIYLLAEKVSYEVDF